MSLNTKAELHMKGGPGGDATITVTKSPFRIGRTGADWNVDDHAVSRHHCEIVLTGNTWIIRDLGSSNGTFVNGTRAGEQALKAGDQVKVGKTEFSFKPVRAAAEKGGMGVIEETALWTLVELGIGSPDLKKWVTSYITALLKNFRSDRGFVVSWNRRTGAIMPMAGVSMEFGAEESEGESTVSRSIVEQAIKERRGVLTTNAELDPRFREATSVAKFDVRAVVCVPTRWQGDVTGAVYLERVMAEDPYSEQEAQSLQDFADILGIAIKAWDGHVVSNRDEWERAGLARSFSESRIAKLMDAGGADLVKRELHEATVLNYRLGRLEEAFLQPSEEVWRQVSQMFAQLDEIILRHDGEILGPGRAIFGGLEGESVECHSEAVKTAIDIQRAARVALKRIHKDTKAVISMGVGLATGQVLTGFFGAGSRVEFMAMGEALEVANGLAGQAQDGEILADQYAYSKIHVFVNTQRLPPMSVTGVDRQVQVYRVVPL